MFEGIDNAYPLTPLQEGILYEVLKAPGSDVYVAYVLIDIEGVLNEAVFKQAWIDTVQQHETLRTRFVWEGLDEPLQLIDSQVSLPWTTVEASAEDQHKTESALLEHWLQRERSTKLSLSDCPPQRLRLIKFNADHSTLMWTVHHLLADDWSTPVVLKSVLKNYSLLMDEPIRAHSEPSSALAFSDYVDWLSISDFGESERWWKENLHGVEATPLPVGHSLKMEEQSRISGFHPRLKLQLDELCASNVLKFSQQTGVTQSSLFHAAWALTLSQYGASHQPVFGTSVSGRTCPLAGIDEAVGLFLNTLPTRIRIEPEQTTIDFALSVQSLLFDQMSHEHIPLSVLQCAHSTSASSPLFESVLVIESHGADLNLASQNRQAIRFGHVRYETDSNYPLTVLVFPADRPEVHFLAKKSFMDKTLLVQLGGSFLRILSQLCDHRNTTVSQVLSDHQRTLQPSATNLHAGHSPEKPAVQTIDQWLADTAIQHVNDIAVRQEDEYVSYGVLLQRALSLANDIVEFAPQGDCLGVYMGRSVDQIVAILAVILSGRGYLALDVEWPSKRIHQMVEAAQCSLIISCSDHLASLEVLSVYVLNLDTQRGIQEGSIRHEQSSANQEEITELDVAHVINASVCLETGSQLRDVAAGVASLRERLAPALHEGSLAYLMFTSGSTGMPKAVPVSHRNLMYSTAARLEYYSSQPESYLLLSSLAFDSSVAGVFWTLCTGGTLVLQNNSGSNDMDELSELIEQHQVSHTLCLPSLYALLLQYAAPQKLQSLKTVIVAGEACPDYLPALHRQTLSTTQLYNEYGPTEATVWASVACLHSIEGPSLDAANDIPIGEPVPGCQIQVRNSSGERCPIGIIGEILISSPGVVANFRSTLQLDNESFTQGVTVDPVWGDCLTYRSGDLGFIDTNALVYYSGRVDEQVKIRGYRVDPAEIAWRVEQQADVSAAYCLSVTLPPPGNQRSSLVADEAVEPKNLPPTTTQQLVCFIVPASYWQSGPCRLLEGEVVVQQMMSIVSKAKACIAKELPAYFTVSRYVAISHLPLLPNGKIDKQWLRELDFQSTNSHSSAGGNSTSIEPMFASVDARTHDHTSASTETTIRLCRLLEEQLGIGGIAATDNFFSLGGDSLTAIRFVARCREQGIGLNIPMVSQFSTLGALGHALHENATQAANVHTLVSRISAFGDTPLTPIQRWFFTQDMPQPEQWNMGFVLSLPNSLDGQSLSQVIEQVVSTMPVLGTRFTRHEGMWAAYIPKQLDVSCLVRCVKEPENDEDWASQLVDAQKQFNLDTGRLVSILLGENSTQGGCRTVGVVIHHLVTDALSNYFLAERLLQAVSSLKVQQSVATDASSGSDMAHRKPSVSNQRPPTPIAASTSYRAWATQLASKLAPWDNNRLSTLIPSVWREDEVVTTCCVVENSVVKDLTAYCHKAGVELHEALLLALMSSTSSQAKLQVDLELHGRDLMVDDIDVSSTIGWFTSFYRLPACEVAMMDITEFSNLLRESRDKGQSMFLQDPESFFTPVQKTLHPDASMATIPFLYNFLVGASGKVFESDVSGEPNRKMHQSASVRHLFDARLRHPASPRSHPVDCVVLDGKAGTLEVMWRIDRRYTQHMDIDAWQSSFQEYLVVLSRNDLKLTTIADDKFSGSGLDADELERLLDSFE